jgi:hypothetical protein
MNPQEPQEEQHPLQPIDPPYVEPVVAESPKKSKKRLALILIIGPTVLFVAAIIISALSNLFFSAQISESELFGQVPIGKTILNIFSFLFGAIAILTWLPGLIIGIILLTKQSK